jgi:hypothetical protein
MRGLEYVKNDIRELEVKKWGIKLNNRKWASLENTAKALRQP